jgi:ribosomal protein S18 acetylase RimI-like enzyme
VSQVSSRVVVRHLAPGDDHAAVGRLVQAGYFGLPDYPREEEYDAAIAQVAERGDGSVVVVAELDGRVVGCLTYAAHHTMVDAEHDDPEAATFRFFAVDPTTQGRGVGETMVRWVFDRARADGKRRIHIHTLTVMRGAQRLYERLGFTRLPADDADWDGVIGLAYVADVPPG